MSKEIFIVTKITILFQAHALNFKGAKSCSRVSYTPIVVTGEEYGSVSHNIGWYADNSPRCNSQSFFCIWAWCYYLVDLYAYNFYVVVYILPAATELFCLNTVSEDF
jgi:hypothetical protein